MDALSEPTLAMYAMKGAARMYPGFKELLSAFNAHNVRYPIVGGYAVSFHAQPRVTKDRDIPVRPCLLYTSLMVGGNIAGVTRTVSISIYDQVQALRYGAALETSLFLLAFSFVVLAVTYFLQRRIWAVWPMS